MFKTLFLLCCLIASVFSDCSSFTTAAQCSGGSSSISGSMCVWTEGSSCNGQTIGQCLTTSSNTVCSSSLQCGMANSNVYYLFRSTCLPSGVTPVAMTNCQCNTGCPSSCPSCQVCNMNGSCVAGPSECSALSSSGACPDGYTCSSLVCNGVCTPNPNAVCTNGNPVVNCTLSTSCTVPPPATCTGTSIVCKPDICNNCNPIYVQTLAVSNSVTPCTGCEGQCGASPPTTISFNCSDGSVGGFTGNCVPTPNGCGWEYRQCPCNFDPRTCPNSASFTPCPYGYVPDSTGCPTCQCRPAPNCTVTSAANCDLMNPCPAGSRPVPVPGSCCPNCVPDCSLVYCPVVTCAAGFVSVKLPGSCCSICAHAPNCNSTCVNPGTCPNGYTTVTDYCGCNHCHPPVNCDYSQCAQNLIPSTNNPHPCPAGFKLAVLDGQCCPTCIPIPTCQGVVCDPITCPNGEMSVQGDAQCCPSCVNCSTVFCGVPPCPAQFRITRTGTCCPTCQLCRYSNTTVCDNNGNSVCRAGFFTGSDCSTPVPSSQSESVTITAKVCLTISYNLTAEEVATLIIALLKPNAVVTAANIQVTSMVPISGTMCWMITVTVSASTSSGMNIQTAGQNVADAMNSDNTGTFSNVEYQNSNNPTPSPTASASSLIPAFFLLALMFFLM